MEHDLVEQAILIQEKSVETAMWRIYRIIGEAEPYQSPAIINR